MMDLTSINNKQKFYDKYGIDKNYRKFRDHYHYPREYRGAAHSICNFKYSVPQQDPIAFHNGSDYDYHFIIITCLGENTGKYITFTVMIEKEMTKLEKKLQKIYLTYYNLLIGKIYGKVFIKSCQ